MKNIVFTDESVKMQITGSISENLTDSEKIRPQAKIHNFAFNYSNIVIEGIIQKKKDYFLLKNLKSNVFNKFHFQVIFFHIAFY